MEPELKDFLAQIVGVLIFLIDPLADEDEDDGDFWLGIQEALTEAGTKAGLYS